MGSISIFHLQRVQLLRAAPPPNIKGEAEGEKGALNKTQALSNNVNYTHIKK